MCEVRKMREAHCKILFVSAVTLQAVKYSLICVHQYLFVMFCRYAFLFVFGLFFSNAQAQSSVSVHLEPFDIPGLGGLQSFASADYEGRWLLIGGRLDGLHRRQPWASFDIAGHNTLLTVADPVSAEVWTRPLSDLPADLAEQLSSTNMQFVKNGDFLYLIGGYGYSAQADDHMTYPKLTAVYLPGVINAVMAGENPVQHFRQFENEMLAVTGGYLHRLNGMYYLVGGHRFSGRYNPMNNPTFSQQYTDALRVFAIEDDGTNLSVSMADEWVDEAAFHRRDYNVAAQIMPDGSEGLTAFSGVFQPAADIPYLNAVNIVAEGYEIQADFAQYFNHYHCAHIPLYDEAENEMHTLFFGGIAQYYMDGEELVQDDNVPFVNTIARVTRTADGSMAEYKLPTEMPGLLGSGSEFIPAPGIPAFGNGVIKLNDLEGDSVLVGYIVGGIHSSAPNIFWTNNGTQSVAHSTVFKAYLTVSGTLSDDRLNELSMNTMKLQAYPNPSDGRLNISFHLKVPEDVFIHVTDLNGRVAVRERLQKKDLSTGKNEWTLQSDQLAAGVYIFSLRTGGGMWGTQRIVLNPR